MTGWFLAPVGAVVLVGLVGLACLGPLFAAAACCVALSLALIAALGMERVGAFVVTLALVTAPMNAVRPSASVSFVTMSDVFFLLGFALLVPRMLGSRLRLPAKYVAGAVLLLVSGTLSSLVAAGNVDLSLNLLGRLVAASMVLPVAFMLWSPSARMVDVLAAAYVVGQTISVADAVIKGPIDNGRYDGLTIHPNFFAMCSITGLALILHLLHRVHRRWHLILLLAIAVNAYGAYLSGSRMGIGLLIVLAITYGLVERSALSLYAVTAIGVIGLLATSVLLSHAGSESAISRLRGNATAATSDSVRHDQLQAAFAAIHRSPVIGNGFENALDAQNIYLQIGVSAGILGLIGFLLMFISIIEPLFQGGPMHRLGYASFTYAVGGLLTASLWDRMVWAGLSLALLASLWSPARRPDDRTTPVGTPALVPALTREHR